MNNVKKIHASNLLEYYTDDYLFRIENYNYNEKISGNVEIFIKNESGDYDLFHIQLEDLQYILDDINNINEKLDN